MNIGTKFQPEIAGKNYDVIIIGSGISGLALANLQAKQGRSVLVIEKHYTAGGLTHTYRRKGYEWDSGLHYVGDVHKPGHLMRILFDFISDDELKWNALPEEYDRLIYPDQNYSFIAGKDNFRESLLRSFPREKKALDDYLNLIQKVRNGFARTTLAKSYSLDLSGLFDGQGYFKQNTYEVLKKLTQDERLISVLCGQWGDYALPPKRSSFGAHAVIAHHYLDGGAFPIGGSSQVAKTIVHSIEKNGGKVVVATEVKKILVRKNQAYGVMLQDGTIIEGKQIVSSAGVHQTYLNLFDQADLPEQLKKNVVRLKPSVGFFSLNLSVNRDESFLNHHGGNLWIYPSYDHDRNYENYLADPLNSPPPMFYLSFPSLKDPSWKERIGPKSTISVLGVADYAWFEKWEHTQARRRDGEYEDLKEKIAQPYLKTILKIFPQFEGKIDHLETSSPLSMKHFASYLRGEIYGLELSPQRFRETWLRPKTPIKNFYLTGQDIVLNGVCGGLVSAVVTSTAMHPFATAMQLAPLGIFKHASGLKPST